MTDENDNVADAFHFRVPDDSREVVKVIKVRKSRLAFWRRMGWVSDWNVAGDRYSTAFGARIEVVPDDSEEDVP